MSKTLHYVETLKGIFERTLEQNLLQLAQLPKGTLISKESKGHRYLFWAYPSDSIPGKRKTTPLKEKDRQLIDQLRRQRIIRKQIPLLKNNIKAAKKFLKAYKPCDESACLEGLSIAYSENLDFQGFDKLEKNPSYPQDLKHTNSNGELFRSRIEVQISELLLARKVKYDYDVALKLGDKTRYPDFRITHPKTGEFIYVEYFGKMIEDQYAQDNLVKIQEYLRAGYTYGKNLMFIFENSKGIDIAAIARIIDMLIA